MAHTVDVDLETFAGWVSEAVSSLPDQFAEKLQNVEILVEDWPDSEAMYAAGVNHRMDLLGLYWGVPLIERTQGYNLVAPDKISIYRLPIMEHCRTRAEVRQMIRKVVRHEVAHYFGITDERLHELGAY
jgi:predicted Zn-dependent protease with MMP-like domain